MSAFAWTLARAFAMQARASPVMSEEASTTEVFEASVPWVSMLTEIHPVAPGSRHEAIADAGDGESSRVPPQLPLPEGSKTPTFTDDAGVRVSWEMVCGCAETGAGL